QFLLCRQRQRQQLGEAGADPRGGIEPMRRREEARVLLDHPLGQAYACGAARRDGSVALRVEKRDASALQAVALDAALEDAEAALALRDDLEQAELRHIPLRDDCGAADIGRDRGRADASDD